ncbi:hypothetical protein [Polaromonas sp. CG9_12]|nr:hypothetical protein [Polaromonas sp. CG9_12]
MPTIQIFCIGLLWAVIGFIYGLFFSYAFKKNRSTCNASTAA